MIADNFEEKVLNGEKLSEDELSYLIHEYEIETAFGEKTTLVKECDNYIRGSRSLFYD